MNTIRRDAVLSFYRTHYETRGISPTVREASDALGYSVPTVHAYVRILAAEGLLQRMGRRGYIPAREAVR